MSDDFIGLEEWEARQSPEVRAEIERRYQRHLQRLADLRAVRQLVGCSQAELAARMGTNQPALSKIERRGDLSFRNLRQFAREIGAELDIVLRIPGHPPGRVDNLSDGPP